MIHLTLALAIVISNLALKPFLMAVLLAPDMPSFGIRRFQLLAELSLVLGLLIAWLIVRRTQLAQQLPRPIQGSRALVFGISLYFVVLFSILASQLIEYVRFLVMLIGAYPVHYILTSSQYILDSRLIWPTINVALLYGIGRALLSANSQSAAITKKGE